MSNDEYQQQLFWDNLEKPNIKYLTIEQTNKLKNYKMRTISQNFNDNQIKGVLMIDGKRVLYLKTGVKKKFYNDDLGNGEFFPQLNQDLINYEKAKEHKKAIFGEEDFENE